MALETFSKFNDFELLDSGNEYRLERWADVVLARPDPQAIWQRHLGEKEWSKANAIFDDKKREWVFKKSVPESWIIDQGTIKLLAKLTPFKHTGIFAEQGANWEWMKRKLQDTSSKLRILNLFGYTGGATILLAKLGHFVTHVDASKPAIAWAKENQKLNNLPDNSIRWILDDAAKFVTRELKRSQTYDAIIMDPPAFGHSPSGKTWKFADDVPGLLSDCEKLLSGNAQFLIINAYATNSSSTALQNLMEDTFKNRKGKIESGELCLKQKDGRMVSTGIVSRWQK